MSTPLGPVRLMVADEGLCLLRFLDADDPGLDREALSVATGRRVTEGGHPLLGRVHAQLEEYFEGRRHAFDLPLLLPGTDFERRVWDVLRQIPLGTTRSYAWVAGQAGCPGGARAAGGANGRNRVALVIPCHRVVPAHGGVGGFSAGVWRKRWLLEMEATGRPPSSSHSPPIPCAS